jgi:ankyrin repeat protein
METVTALLEHGADANAQDNKGHSALMKAAQKGHIAVAQALVVKGADPSMSDNSGRTALAIAEEKQHAELVRLLSAPAR